jgi:hypothetical protein
VYGQVHRALLAWDDGEASDSYVVDSTTWSSFFGLEGKGKIRPGVNAGFIIELQSDDALSGGVSQIDDEGFGGEGGIRLSKALVFIEHEKLGTLTIGTGSEATDLIAASDLSGSDIISSSAPTDWNGSFFLREKGVPGLPGIASGLTWNDVLLSNAGDGADNHTIVRYDTPSIRGLILSASWGENDIWAVGGRYEGEWNSIKLHAALGYTGYNEVFDTPCIAIADRVRPSCNTLAGSVAVIHQPTGLNIAFAAGKVWNDFSTSNFPTTDNHDLWYYTKLGLYRRFVPFGQTSLYAEYYHSNESLFFPVAAGATNLAEDAFVTGATGNVWGVGIVQHYDALPLETYVAFRQYRVDADGITADAFGKKVDFDFDRFNALMVGSRISF